MDGIAIRTSGWILSGLGLGLGTLLTVVNRTADLPAEDRSYPVVLGATAVMVLAGLAFVYFGGRRAEREAAAALHRAQGDSAPN
jgi:hypothetical protein